MIVIYRMCGIPSTNPSPVFQEDKFKLSQLCLRSFVQAFKEVKPRVIFLNDFCDPRYTEIEDRIPFEHEIINTEIGINGTMLKSYEIANSQDEDILFQECDYLYLHNTGLSLREGLDALGLVSPYDHPDHYPFNGQLCLVNDQHWRGVANNTMTFAIKNSLFKEKYEIFKKYGYLDHDVWTDIETTLWTPILSLATHMVRNYLAPGINWKLEWEKYI